MAPPRRTSNGRSPLVNQQRQITSFFAKSSGSPSPPPSPVLSKVNLNPNDELESSTSPSASPTTPSPLPAKRKTPLLVIGQSPALPSTLESDSATPPKPSKPLYGEETVNKRVRVYWPLDKSWYEGCVKSFDKISGRHLVQYDDSEEELLNLAEEKIEFVEKGVKKFRRLCRLPNEEDDDEGNVENKESDGDDDSVDEDWGKDMEKEEAVEDEMEGFDLEDEKDDVTQGSKIKSKKRKTTGETKLHFCKKARTGGDFKKKCFKASLDVGEVKFRESAKINDCGQASNHVYEAVQGDAAERIGMREAEKLKFLGKDRRDAKRRHPGDFNYDPRTLFVPPDFLKTLTGGQRQWWEFKSKHMDKVLFFKMGKFYELFEMDAHIGVKELGLQYMKVEQPHCGFPEKNFSVNVEKLVRKGYRILVVEQTETPEQLALRRREKGSKDKVVKREICAIVTRGTLTEGDLLLVNPEASYLMAVTERQISADKNEGRIYGVCVVDVSTSKIVIGQFSDDSECSGLSCLLSQLRPVEIIKPAKLLCSETERVLLRHTRNPLVNELAPVSEFWDAERTISEVKKIYTRINDESMASCLNESMLADSDSYLDNGGKSYLPEVLSELIETGENGVDALSALGGALFYLKQSFLDKTLLKFAKFELLPRSGYSDIIANPYMVLDAAALENLEIFENSRDGDTSGTLYAQLNNCVTSFGKRLLKTWLARPLYHSELIRERQDAIADLKGVNLPSVLELRKELSRLPDMERLIARIFSCSESNGRNANKVVLYEDAAKKQLQDFISALRGCELMRNTCFSLGGILQSANSRIINHLLTTGKGLPDVHSVLLHFKNAFDWVEADNSGRVIPREGGDLEYDAACKKVQEIELSLTKHLKEQRKFLGDAPISYVTIGKDAYLLEVPESLSGRVPREYELQSSKKGFFRYWTPVIKAYLVELGQAESEKESKLKSIMQRLIVRFCEHHNSWRQLVSTVAELDVLISIGIASDLYEGPTCRPVILNSSNADEAPTFCAKSLGHPILRSDSLGKGNFVPNDVRIGGCGYANFILLTGPNMGGKSTLLRQICLAVILAQIGADVPAECFKISPVDRIFVRMGAKDHIMAGQSTFLTELLETAAMLSSATRHSIVALDELGRGTSTSDGQAIASSVLEHFVNKVNCRGMFSTHYHQLAVDHKENPKVSLCHMACQVGEGVGNVEEVTFLYKLTVGVCPKSYGVNVARLAGLPDTVLQNASKKSEEFEGVYGQRKQQSELSRCWGERIKLFTENLANLLLDSTCHLYGKVGLSSLEDLQIKATVLLQQIPN